MQSLKLFWLVFCLIAAVSVEAKRKRMSVGARGTLICSGKRLEGATINLYPDQTGKFETRMGTTVSGKDGSFAIQGSSTDYVTFKPMIVIEHQCRTAKCRRRVSISLPEESYTVGSKPNSLFDMSEIDFTDKYPSEFMVCPNRPPKKF
uniref:Transthyretin-like family protein n=1 Tax=Syphacia muris TaxID=451379 RepID=A0A0N5ADE2_9BILA